MVDVFFVFKSVTSSMDLLAVSVLLAACLRGVSFENSLEARCTRSSFLTGSVSVKTHSSALSVRKITSQIIVSLQLKP